MALVAAAYSSNLGNIVNTYREECSAPGSQVVLGIADRANSCELNTSSAYG